MRPPNPPTMAFREAKRNSNKEGVAEERRRARGATFCQVDRVRHRGHLIEFITEGNQKWKGAIPSLIIRAKDIIKGRDKEKELKRRRLDPSA